MSAPRWISEAEVAGCFSLADAIATIESSLQLAARNQAHEMGKTHLTWGEGHTLHALGAVFPSLGYAGTKTWAHTRGGAAPLLVLFDCKTGGARAVLEAFQLGQLRTAAISGVATKWLADPQADQLAMIGSGKQAWSQVAAVQAVRPLRRVRVFSPNAANRIAFVARLRHDFSFEVSEHESVQAAVAGAPIITLATRAREPFLVPEMVARGAHINAIGAITPERMEFAPQLFDRCTVMTTDSVNSARRLSRECMEYFGESAAGWESLRPLCQIVATQTRRPADCDLTLLKSMGSGIADVGLGIEIMRRLGGSVS